MKRFIGGIYITQISLHTKARNYFRLIPILLVTFAASKAFTQAQAPADWEVLRCEHFSDTTTSFHLRLTSRSSIHDYDLVRHDQLSMSEYRRRYECVYKIVISDSFTNPKGQIIKSGKTIDTIKIPIMLQVNHYIIVTNMGGKEFIQPVYVNHTLK